MTITIAFDSKLALEQYEKRKVASAEAGQIDNASQRAGAPMVYYCKFCGTHTQTLPECHATRPKTVCDPCEVLHVHGLLC